MDSPFLQPSGYRWLGSSEEHCLIVSMYLLLSRTFHLVFGDGPANTSGLVPYAFTRACRLQTRHWCAQDPFDSSPSTCGSSQSISITKQPPCKRVIVPMLAGRDHNCCVYQLPCLLQAHKARTCLKLYDLCSHGGPGVFPPLCSPGDIPPFLLIGLIYCCLLTFLSYPELLQLFCLPPISVPFCTGDLFA